MDLKELTRDSLTRHPWETARLRALHRIIRPHLFNGMKVLDVGCGDGFISRELFSELQTKDITAVDIYLTDDQLMKLNRTRLNISYLNKFPDSSDFDLLLLLEVLEHLEDDAGFLADLVTRYASPGTKFIITVPAFQSLYGPHDINLGHYRRYGLTDIESLILNQGLNVISSGYLFASLLLPKYILCNIFKSGKYSKGVGSWSGSRFKTGFFEMLLNADNHFLLSLAKIGVKIPGLTGWLLCEKRA